MEIALGIILGCCALSAGICMGVGAIGPALGDGSRLYAAFEQECESLP